MTTLTVPAVMALIAAHQCVSPAVAPIMVGVAKHESGLQPFAVHDNMTGRSYAPETREQAVAIARSLIAIGHPSLDLGIAQVTTSNLGWTGLTLETAFDPCRNIAAGSAVLFARYNGSPPGAVRAAYAASVQARIAGVQAPPDKPPDPCPPPDPDGWHVSSRPAACADPDPQEQPEEPHDP